MYSYNYYPKKFHRDLKITRFSLNVGIRDDDLNVQNKRKGTTPPKHKIIKNIEDSKL